MAELCGCTVTLVAEANPVPGQRVIAVVHCPKHAEVDNLLAALGTARVALLNRDKARGLPDERSLWEALAATALDQVQEAIDAAARGGGPVGAAGLTDEDFAGATMRTEGARDTLPRGGAG